MPVSWIFVKNSGNIFVCVTVSLASEVLGRKTKAALLGLYDGRCAAL